MKNSLALLSAEERERFVAGLDVGERALLAYHWPAWARLAQLPPPGPWRTWLFLGGRGAGKTRAGAEWVRGKVETAGAGRIALVGATAADCRDVMALGESGIVATAPPWNRPLYEPSKRRLVWPNGAQAVLYSAEEPDRLRGPQHDAAWADELCTWSKQRECWDMLAFGLRLGSDPQTFVSTTPRPQPLLRELLAMPGCVVTRSTTSENAGNLAAPFMAEITRRYAGTRLGRQELDGQLLEDVEGALWTRAMLEQAYTPLHPGAFKRIIVGLDPSGGGGSAQGIVVAGLGSDGLFYVLEDASCQLSPQLWAQRAVSVERHRPTRSYWKRTWRRSRAGRAHPGPARPAGQAGVGLARQTRARRAGGCCMSRRHWGLVEDQLCAMRPDGYAGEGSPDRLDALVWAITELSGPPNLAYIFGGGRAA